MPKGKIDISATILVGKPFLRGFDAVLGYALLTFGQVSIVARQSASQTATGFMFGFIFADSAFNFFEGAGSFVAFDEVRYCGFAAYSHIWHVCEHGVWDEFALEFV